MTKVNVARIVLLCGNGLSIDRAKHAGLSIDPSSPLEWPVPHPDSSGPLLPALPRLERWLHASLRRGEPHFEAISRLTASSEGTNGPWDWDSFDVHSELRHFLALAYSWYQSQLDETDPSSWAWHSWLKKHRASIIGALSLNYDLVLERSFYWNGIPFFYPGTDGTAITLRHRGSGLPRPIPLAKPHGSCNFASMLRMTPVGYPLPTHTWAGNAPLRILKDSELARARDLADIVTPGEWNVFPRYLTWAAMMHRAFRQMLIACDAVVILGFRFGLPDQGEFSTLLGYVGSQHQVIVADPMPSAALLTYLSSRRITCTLWTSGPQQLV